MVFVGELASCKILSKKKSSSQKLRKKPPSHPLQPYENGCSSRQEPIGQRFAWFPIPAKNQPRVGGGFVVVNRAPFRPVFFLDGFEHGLIFGRKFLGIPNFVSTVKKRWKLPTGKKNRCETWGRDWICSGCCCWYMYIYIYIWLKSRCGKHWREMKSLSL